MRSELRHCGSCGDERPFETPPCADNHGTDCPERVCVRCGAALLVDPPLPDTGTSVIPPTIHAA